MRHYHSDGPVTTCHVAARSCISPVATRCPLSSQAAVVVCMVQVQRSPVITLVVVSKSLLSLQPRPGLPVVHTQVASHTVSHTGAVREGFCSRHHCASSRTSWHRLHVYLHEDEGPSVMMLLNWGDSFMCFCGNPSRERDRKGHHVLK